MLKVNLINQFRNVRVLMRLFILCVFILFIAHLSSAQFIDEFQPATFGVPSKECGLAETIDSRAKVIFKSDRKKGVDTFKKATGLCKSKPAFKLNLAIAHYLNQENDKALDVLLEINKDYPVLRQDLKAYIDKNSVRFNERKEQEDSADLIEWILRNNLAEIYLNKKEYKSAFDIMGNYKYNSRVQPYRKSQLFKYHDVFFTQKLKTDYYFNDQLGVLRECFISTISKDWEGKKHLCEEVKTDYINRIIEKVSHQKRALPDDLFEKFEIFVRPDPELEDFVYMYVQLKVYSGDMISALRKIHYISEHRGFFQRKKRLKNLEKEIVVMAIGDIYETYNLGKSEDAILVAEQLKNNFPQTLSFQKTYDALLNSYINGELKVKVPSKYITPPKVVGEGRLAEILSNFRYGYW